MGKWSYNPYKWSYGPLLMRLPAAIQQHMAAETTCLPARVRIVRLLSDSSPHAKLHLLASLLYSSHSCLHFFDPWTAARLGRISMWLWQWTAHPTFIQVWCLCAWSCSGQRIWISILCIASISKKSCKTSGRLIVKSGLKWLSNN